MSDTDTKALRSDALAIAHTGMDRSFDVLQTLVSNPFIALVAGVSLVEMLQGVLVFKGKYDWVQQPGTHRLEWGKVYEPLLSQGLATTLESGAVVTAALQALDIKTLLPLLR